MKAFLFDKYGYYPEEIVQNRFRYKGWIFTLVNTEQDEEHIKALNDFCVDLAKENYFQSSQIIKNRSEKYISDDGSNKWVLWATKEGSATLNELINLHLKYQNIDKEKNIDLMELIKLWEEKLEFIETKCLSSLRVEENGNDEVLEAIYYAIGLAENAIQYLADTRLDYGEKLGNITIVHKRLNSLENQVFFDPFNFVFSNAVRDLAELYKFNIITVDQLMRLLQKYSLTKQEASVLMARILFPTRLFDSLEAEANSGKDIILEALEYRKNITRENSRIKNVHNLLAKNYGIRPLDWLKDNV